MFPPYLKFMGIVLIFAAFVVIVVYASYFPKNNIMNNQTA